MRVGHVSKPVLRPDRAISVLHLSLISHLLALAPSLQLPILSQLLSPTTMGKIDSAVIEEFDGLASMLGLTPKFNSQNEIIPIGAKDPRGKVYVVWIGRGIGLFYNWYVLHTYYRASATSNAHLPFTGA